MKVSKKLWKLGKSKLATCKIVVRFSNANRLVISTGTTCAPQHWSKTLQCLTDGPNYRQINNQIDQKVLDVINVIKNHPTFTDAQMRKLLDETFLKNKTVAKNKKQSFNQFCRYELAQRTDIALGTLKNHRKILNHFDNITPNCAFREFNTKTIEKINQFCRLNNFTEATTYNFHKIIKYYVNRAILTGFFPNDPTKNPYSLIKIKRSNKTTRSYLSIDEIAKIKNAELPANMELFRDAFLFLCYTGLRISDFMRVNQNMLINDVLKLDPQKTDKFSTSVSLPITKLFDGEPYEIWRKYDFNFPLCKHFDVKLNAAIKLIAQAAKINKKLTCHVARHSFLTCIAMKTGNVFTVMKLGGLRKVDTAMIYIHLAEMDSGSLINGIDWK